MFRHQATSERDVGFTFMTFNEIASHRPAGRAYHRQKGIPWLLMASEYRRATDERDVAPLVIVIQAIQP